MLGAAVRIGTRALIAVALTLTLVFLLLRMAIPDPASALSDLPGLAGAEALELEQLTGQGLPIWEQFWAYLGSIMAGELGFSVTAGQPVAEVIALRFPATFELALAGFIPAFLAALVLSWTVSRYPLPRLAAVTRGLSALGMALPVFVSGLLAIEIFYRRLSLVPQPTGRLDPFLSAPEGPSGLFVLDAALAGEGDLFLAALAQLWLPAAVMALFGFGALYRVMTASLSGVLQGAGVTGAEALGFSERRIFFSYALPEMLGAVMPTACVTFGYMLGANVLVETVFAWPGLGRFALEAMQRQDLVAVQGVVLVFALAFTALNLGGELIATWLDPRLRNGR